MMVLPPHRQLAARTLILFPLLVSKEDLFEAIVLSAHFLKRREKIEKGINGMSLRLWSRR